MELNIEDGGQRQFILCTNNQNNICEKITYKRCRDVITSYDFDKSVRTMLLERKIKVSDLGKSDIPDEIKAVKTEYKDAYSKFATEISDSYLYVYGITVFEKMHGIPANLKYYRTSFVSKDVEYLSDALLEHIAEMVQLEHGVKIDGSEYLIIMNDDELDALEQNWDNCGHVKAIYVSKNVLFTTAQKKLFGSIEIHIIPDNYFQFELKEVGEAW